MSNDQEGFIELGSRKNYTSIMGGLFVQRCEEGDEGAKSRVNKNGKTVWEKTHKGLKIKVTSIYTKEPKDYDKELHIASKGFDIGVPFNSRHSQKFICCLRNIDFDDYIILIPYRIQKKDDKGRPIKDKFVNGWTIYQGGTESDNKVEQYIDSGRDGDLPPLKKTKINGKEAWDATKQLEYLEDHLNTYLDENPQLKPNRAIQVGSDEDESLEEEEEEQEQKPKSKLGKKLNKKKSSEEEDEENPY